MPEVDTLDTTFDLIVVGSGGAGLAGALTAAIDGAKVLVLEKASTIGGTTAVSGGGAWIPCNPHLGEVGQSDTPEEALAYLRACSGSVGDESHLAALVDRGVEAIKFFEEKGGLHFRAWPTGGGTIDYKPWLPGAKHGGRTLSAPEFHLSDLGEWRDRLRLGANSRWVSDPLMYYEKKMHLQRPSKSAISRTGLENKSADPITSVASGAAFIGQMLRSCLKLGVTILTDAPADKLETEGGRVVGVSATYRGQAIRFAATHGVLVATGGFAHNERLKRLWLTRPLEYSCETPECQGEGHLMGMDVGAMVSVGDAWWMPHVPMGEADGKIVAGGTREDRGLPGTLMVNSQGKRFMNEAVNYYDAGEAFGNKVGAPERNFPGWYIFDQAALDRYALVAWKIPESGRPSYLKVADTLDGLALAMGVDSTALGETIRRFNEFARTGVDEDFGRGANPWDVAWGDPENKPNPCLGALKTAPFYAIPIYSGALATRGGLCVNASAQVLSARTGEPIPGLYAAGNCSDGGAAGTYAGAGATIGAGITFGYIAAKKIRDEIRAS